jgi:hypothetical protein
MELTLGDYAMISKDDSVIVAGTINGLKVNRHGIERVSFEGIEHWFWISDGFTFVDTSEEGEQDGSVQPE